MKRVDWDERRKLMIGASSEETIRFAAEQWLQIGREAISEHGFFAVALSGGSTPKAIFQALTDDIEWSKVWLFWSDERAVPPTSAESNYHMALEEGRLKRFPIKNIFRMVAESDIEKNAAEYEEYIRQKIPNTAFDLVMLGIGEDGHTASLFPHTEALHTVDKLVAANQVPQKNTWRMTFTFELINRAKNIIVYALGETKADILQRVLTSAYDPDALPSQRVGTVIHPATIVLDEKASKNLSARLK